jgi:parvulin-like peptidyl-prolyl isomerase
MLRAMRDSFKKLSWTLWLVIIAFVLGFVMTDAFQGQKQAKTGLIFIGEEPVLQGDDYYRQVMRTLLRYKEQMKDFNKSMITQRRIPEQMLQGMIDAIVVRKEAEKLNITASEREIKDMIITRFQRDGQFIGIANYRRFLKESHIDVTEYEGQLRDEVIREKYQELVTAPLVIDDMALREKYKKEKDKADLEYIILKTDRIKEDITVEDKKISDYYEKNKEDFKSIEKRAGYVIALKFDDYKKEAVPTDREMYENFKKNMAEFIVPGKTKVSRILLKYVKENRDEVFKKAEALQKELTKDNFARKAIEFSQDEKAKSGGDHGYEGWKRFTSQERTMIENLGEHQVSSPIDTQSGFSIVYISELVPQKEPVFNEAREKIKNLLQNEKVNQKVMEKLQKIYNKVAKSENIKAKTAEIGVEVIETELLTSGKPIKDVDEMGYISRRLFMMEEKEIAFPVNFVKGTAILQVAKIEKPEVLPLEEVKDKVKDKVVKAKKVDLLTEQAAKISEELNRITDQKNIEAYLTKNDLRAQTLAYKRGNRLSYFPVRKGMDDTVFSMEKDRFSSPFAFEEQQQVVILKVKDKTIALDSDFQKDKTEFYNKKIGELRYRYFDSYLSSKKDSYRITLNQELYQQLKDDIMTRFK